MVSGFIKLAVIILLFALIAFPLILVSIQPVIPPAPVPPPASQNTSALASRNWAGYVVERNFDMPQNGSVSDIKATWIVPSTHDSYGQPNAFSAVWIGIDGFSSTNIEQIGTDSDFFSDTPLYYAWYELFPEDPVYLTMEISPGDTISAEIKYVGSDRFMFSITDVTTGKTFKTMETVMGAARSSAEWVVEAPSSQKGILRLEDFGTVSFSGASVSIDNVTGGILNPDWQDIPILIEKMNNTIEASPSGILPDNSGFVVSWEHS